MDHYIGVGGIKERYFEALLLGERDIARAVIKDAINQKIKITQVYLDVLTPSQVQIGEFWQLGKINVNQENLATSITLNIMDHLRENLKPGDGIGFRALVMPVEGDYHVVGARMIADFLLMDGWSVDFLSNSAPPNDLVEFVSQRRTILVALSSTLPKFLPNAKIAANALQKLNPSPKILLGGQALAMSTLDVQSFGFDAIVEDATEVTRQARLLAGLIQENPTLENNLTLIGQNVNRIRIKLQMTQQELANFSTLDRTYISVVERGKQNLTIGAVLKIANALNVPIQDLISSGD